MRPGRVIIGLVLMLFGVLFLSASLDWIDWSFFLSVWQLWPLILVLIGIQLLLGRSNPTAAAIIMVVIVAGGVGLAVYGWQSDSYIGWGERKTVAIEGPATGGIRKATATLDLGAASIVVDGRDTGRVVSGTYETRGDPYVSQASPSGASSYQIKISQQERSWFLLPFGRHGDDLQLSLATDIPWAIDLNSGATDVTLDLSQVILESLEIDTGASSMDITVGPEIVDGAYVSIQGGAASYDLSLPASLDITVKTKTGVSSVDIDDRFDESPDDVYVHQGGGRQLTVDIEAGVSSVNVDLY